MHRIYIEKLNQIYATYIHRRSLINAHQYCVRIESCSVKKNHYKPSLQNLKAGNEHLTTKTYPFYYSTVIAADVFVLTLLYSFHTADEYIRDALNYF